MKIKGILFDKDGTLLEFNKTWRPIANQVVNEVAKKYGIKNKVELAQAIGVFKDMIDSKSSLSSGTNKDVAMDMLAVIKSIDGVSNKEINLDEYIQWSTDLFNRVAATLPFYPVVGGLDTIKQLKESGYYIGLSTADSVENAKLFLNKTGLDIYFDYIGADDGIINPKPAKDYMNNFCKLYSLKPEEVAVVGDTITDMDFGINSGAGLIVGVLSGTGTRALLSNKAHLVLDSINNLVVDDKVIWEDM